MKPLHFYLLCALVSIILIGYMGWFESQHPIDPTIFLQEK